MSANFKKDYNHIKIYKKFIFWIHVATIYNNDGSYGMELYRQTRNHYRRLWIYTGLDKPKNIRFELIWESEKFDGDSKRIF